MKINDQAYSQSILVILCCCFFKAVGIIKTHRVRTCRREHVYLMAFEDPLFTFAEAPLKEGGRGARIE